MTSVTTTTKMCSECDWWMENGDGSQKVCEICQPTYDYAVAKKRKFISLADFDKKAKLAKPDTITKWGDLPEKGAYHINRIVERDVTIEGRKQKSRYLELDDIVTEERKNVWVTSLIDDELRNYNFKMLTYIRNLGLKKPENGRPYYDFVIVVDDDDNSSDRDGKDE